MINIKKDTLKLFVVLTWSHKPNYVFFRVFCLEAAASLKSEEWKTVAPVGSLVQEKTS